ncbi:MAG: glucosamine-6-phosphate deaminase [Planctomycetia bacterium]|nr:glucosamine-6-phosphate deaminase [Planctomycetia bacterium]
MGQNTIQAGNLRIMKFSSRKAMGDQAGKDAGEAIRKAIQKNGEARVIFAAAPSQDDTLAALVQEKGIDWSKVIALHMDEYIGLPLGSSARFSQYLKDHCFDLLPFKKIFLLDEGDGSLSPEQLCERYDRIIREKPVDVVCMGIGENGHIAFNDPPVADFHDPKAVKIVDLDNVCRMQQVHDGCFPTLDDVPKQAITLTIPTLMAGGTLICTVPGQRKKNAVYNTVYSPISTKCPAAILREHPNATMYLDAESGNW